MLVVGFAALASNVVSQDSEPELFQNADAPGFPAKSVNDVQKEFILDKGSTDECNTGFSSPAIAPGVDFVGPLKNSRNAGATGNTATKSIHDIRNAAKAPSGREPSSGRKVGEQSAHTSFADPIAIYFIFHI